MTPIRKILLPLTGTAAGEAGLTTALMIARQWNAHLTALHVASTAVTWHRSRARASRGAMIEEMMTATEKESSERSQAVRAMFDRFVAAHDVTVSEASRTSR